MQAVSRFLVQEPSPKCWDQVFAGRSGRDLFLEIGCGRGDFILQQAALHPDNNYIAIEGQESVILRAMEKAAQAQKEVAESGRACLWEKMHEADEAVCEAEKTVCEVDETVNRVPGRAEDSGLWRVDNVRFVCCFVNGMETLFSESSLSGIYLNFCDPWPKARHAKRRLTWRGRLQEYAWALKEGGMIEFKTDNDALFDFTLEEIAACGWTPEKMTRDLHAADDPGLRQARSVMTEYEKKFRAAGKNINYVKVTV